MKRRDAVNGVTAQQLRAWAKIRNSAAHGTFDEFTKEQAGAVACGVPEFLTRYL